jgi:cell division transport system permease protein
MHWFRYSFGETWRSLRRQPLSALLAILTIAAAFFVLGGFLVASVNVDRALARWNAAAEFSIYLRDDITQDQRAALNAHLDRTAIVAGRAYVSKTDALARFRRDFPDLAASLTAETANPLPASIDVRLVPHGVNPAGVEAFAADVAAMPGVADVRFDRRWLERLAGLASGLRWGGAIVGTVLLLAAGLTIATVVRLALHARRDEVEIMQLMGAPLSLLRGPLVVEGMVHGGLGAAIAMVGLYAALAAARAQFGPVLSGVMDSAGMASLTPAYAALLVAGGLAVGGLGGYAAARHVR